MIEDLLESLPRERSECLGHHYRIFNTGNHLHGSAGVSSAHVGLRWNGIFTLLCGGMLSLWVILYAAQS